MAPLSQASPKWKNYHCMLLGKPSQNISMLSRQLALSALVACMAACVHEVPIAVDAPYEVDDATASKRHVRLILPDDYWDEYQARSQQELPCTIELYDRATGRLAMHADTVAEAEKYGGYGLDLSMPMGSYDLLAWAQGSAAELMYDTGDLKAVTMTEAAFSESRHWKSLIAYCASMKVEASDDECYVDVNLMRPFALYQLYIIDGHEYSAMAQDRKWPALEDIGVKVAYEGFYPMGINVSTGNANDARSGVSYEIEVEVSDASNILVGEDLVLAHGDDSFLRATLIIYDKNTGDVVTTTSGIKIPYRQGCLTMLSGGWLCSSPSQGGVGIDTNWNEIIVPF